MGDELHARLVVADVMAVVLELGAPHHRLPPYCTALRTEGSVQRICPPGLSAWYAELYPLQSSLFT